jgi:hypothetical protein
MVKIHSEDAGFIAERIYKPTGSVIVIYNAAEQGIDGDFKYAVVCDLHGTIADVPTLALAKSDMRYPEFCEYCTPEVHDYTPQDHYR